MAIRTNVLQPDWGVGVLQGEIGVDVHDATVYTPEFILDKSVDNAIDVKMEMEGGFAHTYHNADQFSLTAYLEQATGPTVYSLPGAPLTFNGSDGDLIGTTLLKFPPALDPTLTRIMIPAGTVSPGVYRMTITLTHTPAGTNQKVFGFVEYGMVEFY